jgi:Zn-finger nucleic acid-binding protein
MAILIDEAGEIERKVVYLKCPVCGELMNRRSYGARSGVVADICKDHGIWLDGGELGRILKWAKAGGQLHDQKRKEEDEAERRVIERSQALNAARLRPSPRPEQMGTMLLSGGVLRVLMGIFR